MDAACGSGEGKEHISSVNRLENQDGSIAEE